MDVKREDMWIEDGYVGIAYNVPDPSTRKYVYLMAREEAIILDNCYTGKVFRAMIEMIEAGKIKPELVIGVPVGFVNVVTSKNLIMSTDVPYIVAKGRKGGSNVAAAICNALIYMLTRA